MQANKIFQLGYSIIPMTEEDVADLDQGTILAWFNILIAEALDTENSIRMANEEELLTEAPWLENLEDDVPYNDKICRRAIPYGVAAYLWTEEDQEYRAQDYRSRFIAALDECSMIHLIDMEDCYADCNDA